MISSCMLADAVEDARGEIVTGLARHPDQAGHGSPWFVQGPFIIRTVPNCAPHSEALLFQKIGQASSPRLPASRMTSRVHTSNDNNRAWFDSIEHGIGKAPHERPAHPAIDDRE